MLCALGSATFATAAAGRWSVGSLGAMLLGFVVAAAWLQPDPVWTGSLGVLVAGFHIFRPGARVVTAAAAGVLAGLWSGLLQGQGVPVAPALMLAGSVPGVTAWLAAWRTDFAPPELTEDAMLGVCALGLVVAVAPDIAAGWRSAAMLNLEPGGGVRGIIEVWVLVLSAGAVALGGAHALWRRR